MDQSDSEFDGVRVLPLKSNFLEQYANRFGRWAGLDIFYYLLPVAWAAWAQVQEDFDYDVVEVTDWALLFLPWVAAEKRASVVVSLHGSCGQVDWFGKGEPRSLDGDWVRMVEAVALRGADVVHANSRVNAEFWREKTGREILVIPPAHGGRVAADGGGLMADGSKLVPSSATGDALDPRPSTLDSVPPATSYPLPATAPQARKGLVVGRLQNLKGAELLCQALRLVPEVEIEWAGGDTDWGQSGMKASEYLAGNYPDIFGKRLRWLGQLDRAEVSEKMQAASFLVAPSFLDVFNLTVAEGMEAGLPVVCSRAAGAEMLIEHGHSGFLFDPAKPEELAACLNRIVEMSAVDRNAMGHKAQEAVKTLLSEERILNLLEGSYKEAIEKGTPQRIDEWLESLLFPGAGLKEPSQVGFARRGLRKFGRILTKI